LTDGATAFGGAGEGGGWGSDGATEALDAEGVGDEGVGGIDDEDALEDGEGFVAGVGDGGEPEEGVFVLGFGFDDADEDFARKATVADADGLHGVAEEPGFGGSALHEILRNQVCQVNKKL
jgi:hypothetical protein